MATITACSSASSITRAATTQNASAVRHHPSFVIGLPSMSKNISKVRCTMEGNPQESESKRGMAASLAAAAACAAAMSSPAVALVDDRLSTEGTGLPLGLSNNLLGWILLGLFALIWALYFVYTSTLEEDEDSGLSL